MNLSQMHHLLAVHKTGSFSRAAEQLHLTQPALSRSIQALEEELGLPLIDRIGKRNEFTAFGLAVIKRAKRIAFEAEEIRRTAQLLQGGLAGSIRIGMGAGPSALFMKPLLRRLAHEYPMVHVDVWQAGGEVLLKQLDDKMLDVLVLDTRVANPTEDLQVEQLPDARAGFLCRQGHPLLSLPQVGIEELSRYRVASSHLSAEIGRFLLERYGPLAHPDRLVTMRSDSLEALLETVAQSDIVYLGIRALACVALSEGKLAELQLTPALESSARYGLYTLAGRTQPPALAIVRKLILEAAREILG
jgi:DNA-binding transcriptional LysR family regulator